MNRPLSLWYYSAVLFLGLLIFSFLKINLDAYKEHQIVPIPLIPSSPPIINLDRQEAFDWKYSQEKKVYLVTWNGQSRELILYKNNHYFFRDSWGNYSNGYWTKSSKNNRTYFTLDSYNFDREEYILPFLSENRNWPDLNTKIQFQDKMFMLTYEHKLKDMEDGVQYYEKEYIYFN